MFITKSSKSDVPSDEEDVDENQSSDDKYLLEVVNHQ